MDENPHTEEALRHVDAIESAIENYQSAQKGRGRASESSGRSKATRKSILNEAESDIVDAAERLLIAGAVVRVLTARADTAKPQAALKALGEIVVASEGFLTWHVSESSRARLSEEIESLCNTVGLTPIVLPDP